MRLLLATHNEHKRREFARLLPGHDIDVLPDEVALPPEDGLTFEENAFGKARAAAHATGRTTIADDSGIEAESLGGAPGVRSARYAGESATDAENLDKLLAQAPAGSGLRYRCALAYVDPGSGEEMMFVGCCDGTLAADPRGSGGFGYDPAFVPDDEPPLATDAQPAWESGAQAARGRISLADAESLLDGQRRTMAELSDGEKDAISHRGRAARALLAWLDAERSEQDAERSEQVDRR